MTTNNKAFLAALAVLALVAFHGSCASATSLSDLFGSAVSGTTGFGPYNDGDGLSGTVEYAVFSKAAFELNFSASSVTVGANELAYVYQILNTGTDFVSQNVQLGINSSAVDIGSATIDGFAGETSPTSSSIVLPTASWNFVTNIPGLTGRSSALVLTSTNLPNSTATQIIINGGGTAFTSAIVPSDIPIPEPSSLCLLAGSLAFLAVRHRTRGV